MNISPSSLRLFCETVRHLRLEQIYRRAWFRASHPKPDIRPAPALRWLEPSKWVAPARRRQCQTGSNEFRFLNETRSLAAHGWDHAEVPKLWRYNLHYFDDINAEGATARAEWHQALITRWIAENPPGLGTGWEPYPTSLRIVNWIKWALAGNSLAPEAVQSLAVQVRWLRRRLEHHLLGNHLFANAKALVFAGCFFEGTEAERWLDQGMWILAREVPEQILSDGGHFELSTMYHALALEDMLDLVNIMRSFGNSQAVRISGWTARIDTMREWLAAMCHPDGEIAFFNDAAIGIAPSPVELEDYAIRLGFAQPIGGAAPLRWMRESGYIRLDNGRAVVMLDVARIGPDYLPGHAHADTLSFELSLEGRRVLVNSGTSVYGASAERLRQRGTAAHNTVMVDRKDSSEVWSGFRVARRARPKGLSVRQENTGCNVACAHDGYRRLPGRPTHRRNWRFGKGRLAVSDLVEGRHCNAIAAFHFHPDLSVSAATDGASGKVTLAQETILRWRVDKGRARLETSTWHPEFGVSASARRLVVDLEEGDSRVEFSWVDD